MLCFEEQKQSLLCGVGCMEVVGVEEENVGRWWAWLRVASARLVVWNRAIRAVGFTVAEHKSVMVVVYYGLVAGGGWAYSDWVEAVRVLGLFLMCCKRLGRGLWGRKGWWVVSDVLGVLVMAVTWVMWGVAALGFIGDFHEQKDFILLGLRLLTWRWSWNCNPFERALFSEF